jgi:multiple sugar transport system ATP-binding protein
VSFLQLEQLEKTWPDGTRAVRAVDLAIERGEFIVLLGPSGCGKTTTLRMIAGLEQPTAGRIVLDGRDVTHLPASARDIGMVFQFYALYPHLSVAENIAFPLECAGVAKSERLAVARRLAEQLELTHLLARRPRGLSGGDQQRVALARAMARKPAAWLMDEPLGTLDASRRADMCEFIRAQQLEHGVATVYVTHDQEEALRLADRVVVMSAGAVLQVGPPHEVYDEPADLFVARFVGSPGMNLIDAEATGAGASLQPRGCEVKLASPKPVRPGAVVLGVRPEHVRLDPRGELRGRVVLDAFMGSHRYVHVDAACGRVVALQPALSSSATGEEVRLSIEPRGLRVFDGQGGRRLA